jgi:CheY-like chemotaxis protein
MSKDPLRMLVADDHRDAADTMAMVLSLWGHSVHVAHSGAEAVKAAADFQPRVVLLDISMPKLNGYEVAQRIRQQTGGEDMVLIALTGREEQVDKRLAEAARFDHHLTKPVDHRKLQKLLAEL